MLISKLDASKHKMLKVKCFVNRRQKPLEYLLLTNYIEQNYKAILKTTKPKHLGVKQCY